MEVIVPAQPIVSHQILSVWLDGRDTLKYREVRKQERSRELELSQMSDSDSESEAKKVRSEDVKSEVDGKSVQAGGSQLSSNSQILPPRSPSSQDVITYHKTIVLRRK